jgi:hypothetical protein
VAEVIAAEIGAAVVAAHQIQALILSMETIMKPTVELA